MLVDKEFADCYQNLFSFLSDEHGLTCTISEMDEIIAKSIAVTQKVNLLSLRRTNTMINQGQKKNKKCK